MKRNLYNCKYRKCNYSQCNVTESAVAMGTYDHLKMDYGQTKGCLKVLSGTPLEYRQ